MSSFLIKEREQAGWRFLVLWLLASGLGFGLGAAIEFLVVDHLTFYLAIPLCAFAQAHVINRHISIYLPWFVGTTIFWLIGLAVSARVLSIMMPTDTLLLQTSFFMIISAIAGLLAGIPQWVFMRDWLPIGIWWLIVSAVSYAVFFIPGLIMGLILVRLISADKINMEKRHYEVSGKLDNIKAST
ncbi:MAG: hypothetical protein AAFV93_21940 [Chloroflexota bacterium]